MHPQTIFDFSNDPYRVIIDEHVPWMGDGENLADQYCTALWRLIYGFYNNDDTYDARIPADNENNTPSRCANWLAQHSDECRDILRDGLNEKPYDQTLKALVEYIVDQERLEAWEQMEKDGDIYHCEGEFNV